MGTEVHYKNLFPGYHSMRNVNEDSSNNSWHLFNALTNDHYYDGFTQQTVTDPYSGHDKDGLKQRMLQHEAVFKNQVYELHRLYKRQQDIMDEVKRKEFNNYPISIDTSSSSSPQKPYKDSDRWQNPSFPLGNSNIKSRSSIFGVDIGNSSKRDGSKDCEIVECRPSKVRKKLFDLQLPGHEYIDWEESKHISEVSSYKENGLVTQNGVKTFLDDGGKKDGYAYAASGQQFMRARGLADLNEPVYGQEVDFLGTFAKPERFSNLPGNNGGNANHTSQYFETSKLVTPGTMQHLHNKEFRHRGIYSEISSNKQDYSCFNQTPLLFNASSAYPFASTSNMGNSLSSSWIKSTDSLTHNLTSLPPHTSFLSSHKNHEVFRARNGNGFYNGSSSKPKELPSRLRSAGFGFQKPFKGSNFIDLTDTTNDMDLNTAQNLSKEDDNSRKCDQSVLPWLRDADLIEKKDNSLCANTKLLGFPIFENKKKDDSSAVSTSTEHRGIDINVPLDDNADDDDDDDTEIKNFKNHFDLNSCVTEDEESLLVMESDKHSTKTTLEIDLEAPVVSDIIEDDEKIAAEAIIAISSQQKHVGPMSDNDNDSSDDRLLWFAEVVNSRETDEYEMLTLQLEEVKEQDYMPTPLAPDLQEPEEVVPACRPRRGHTRRGRPRRDFQRDILPGITSLSRHEITEDLQIFGGLMKATGHSWNLGSRRSGKRVGIQGRRKAKAVEAPTARSPPLPPVLEVVGLDERRLTGWGKITRRPRRQRCAAGNSVAVQLT
ncbi:uncharacterized protein LOC143564003 [Bidens hawaiensis]|uniref:uncharacterized protein LOC143564003 n=1 Tax=Bidens hawaiensis TaxID=980011 RepID=UPI0040497ED0